MISIKEARQILGMKAEKMADDQIKNILDYLYALSNRAIINTLKLLYDS